MARTGLRSRTSAPVPAPFMRWPSTTLGSRSVLFGGRNPAGLLGDTWEWDGENWTQVADSGPARRVGHAMAFDRNRNRVVLFGGDSAGRLSDTWEWDGNEWVQQGDTGPSARIHPAMAYDTARSRLVLFGGAAQDAGLGDTWEWDGNAWTEESDFGPDPCAGGAMVFKGSRVALFGGIASIASPPPPAGTGHLRPELGVGWPSLDRASGHGTRRSSVSRDGIRRGAIASGAVRRIDGSHRRRWRTSRDPRRHVGTVRGRSGDRRRARSRHDWGGHDRGRSQSRFKLAARCSSP